MSEGNATDNQTDAVTWQAETQRVEDTIAWGRRVGEQCRGGDLIALVGELGAGKTRFVQGLAEGVGATSVPVTSPTFVIVQEYEPPPKLPPKLSPNADVANPESSSADEGTPRAWPLIHIDAYRLDSLDDLESIGWETTGDVLGGEMRQGVVIAIEWADRLGELAGQDRLEVSIDHVDDNTRTLRFAAHGAWEKRAAALMK